MPLKHRHCQPSRFLHKRKANNQFFRVAADLWPLYQGVSRWKGPRRSFSCSIKLLCYFLRLMVGRLVDWLVYTSNWTVDPEIPFKVVGDLVTDRVTSGTKHLSLHGDRSVIVTSCGKSMEWTWWQVWQCYRGMEFELSCAHRLWGDACKMLRENKKY